MRKISPIFFTIFLVFAICCVRAQRGNTWFFGKRAGLSFNTAPPTPLLDGQINTLEGNSTISDENGDFLFYTNGETIFNRDHDPMLNGLGLKGHISSFQAAVIVPRPGNKNIYYVFTSDALENSFANGYNYHVVDMTLDGGRGDVSSKNNFLSGPSSERLTAVTAGDRKSYWVITNQAFTDVFRVYRVDCSGVNTTPVESTVGKRTDESDYTNIGVLRVSPDGKYLIQTNVKGRGIGTPTNEYAQLFDFDNNTGVISNPRLIPLLNDGYYFGAEFSPNSQFLYITNTASKTVHQFDVSSGNLAAILASKQILPASEGVIAGITLGPDEKIYIATGSDYLHVINDPNNSGAASNLVLHQQMLGTRQSQLSVPNINPNFLTNKPVDFTFTVAANCNGLVQFNSQVQIAGVNYSWDFGDGESATGPNPTHTYTNVNNEYLVKLTVTDNVGCVNEVVGKKIIPAGGTIEGGFSAVVECDQLQISFTDTTKYPNGSYTTVYHFGDGGMSNDNNPVHVYPQNGTYTVKQITIGGGGCVTDTVERTFDFTKPIISAGPDITATTPNLIQLNATGGVRYHWDPPTNLSDPDIANPLMNPRDDMTYVVTGYNDNGCFNNDTINIKAIKDLLIEVPNAFAPASARNAVLRPLLRLIDHINYFRVYNRWGQLVFETKEIGKGWDGTIKGDKQATGTYTWMLEVVDFNGVVYKKIGTSVLIR